MERRTHSTNAESAMDPDYRLAVSRNIAKQTGCNNVILFDDVVNAVDPSQRHELTGLPGYERAIIPAIPLTVALDTTVITQAPPLPSELVLAQAILDKVPNRRGFKILTPVDGEFVDIFMLFTKDPQKYQELVLTTYQNPPTDNPAFHVDAVQEIFGHNGIGKSLLLPFQTTDWHYQQFKDLISDGGVVLPSSSQRWISKGEAYEYFESANLGHLFPKTHFIRMDPRREKSADNLLALSDNIADVCHNMVQNGKVPYVKLVSAGVSGIGNVRPDDNQLLDNNLDVGAKRDKFRKLVLSKLQHAVQTPDAVVEEAQRTERDSFGRREYIASGVVVDCQFHLWSVCRTVNTEQDHYNGMMCAPSPKEIGLPAETYMKIASDMSDLAHAMAEGGYELGYATKDLILVGDRQVFNDNNDRRGGRSVGEVVSAFLEIAIYDKDYSVEVPAGLSHGEFSMKLTNKLMAEGYFPYGTCTTYFPKANGTQTIVKVKALCPLSQLTENKLEGEEIDTAADRILSRVVESIK